MVTNITQDDGQYLQFDNVKMGLQLSFCAQIWRTVSEVGMHYKLLVLSVANQDIKNQVSLY
jgi:hypothetical protein